MTLPTHCVAAGGLIRNTDGKFLLVKNPRRGWEFPGGLIEVGETIPQALKREIFEESGVEVEINYLAVIYSQTSIRDGYNGVDKIPTTVGMAFMCTYLSGEPRISEEHLDIGWFTEDEMFAVVTRPRLIERIKHILNFNGQIHYHAHNADDEITDEVLI